MSPSWFQRWRSRLLPRPAVPARPPGATWRRSTTSPTRVRWRGRAASPDWLGVSRPTVTVTLQRLARGGWVEVAGDRSITLTARGEAAASDLVRRHRILERWLVDVLGLDWAAGDREASLLVHGRPAEVVDRLDGHLGHPRTCPHGNPVPGRGIIPADLVRLDRLPVGEPAAVVRISEVAEHEAPPAAPPARRSGRHAGSERDRAHPRRRPRRRGGGQAGDAGAGRGAGGLGRADRVRRSGSRCAGRRSRSRCAGRRSRSRCAGRRSRSRCARSIVHLAPVG